MKRILSVFLSAILLSLSLLALPGSAEETVRVLPKPRAGSELAQVGALPDLRRDIAKGLTSSGYSSEHQSGAAWSANPLTEAQLTDIANAKKYGISAIGVSALERPIKAATDGVWANGNVGMALSTNRKEKGAMAWMPDGKTYNASGAAGEGEDFPYSLLLTLNFGKIANLEQFGFISTNAFNLPQAADIYVSNDGEAWTPVGFYDRCAKRQAGQELTFLAAKELGADAKPGEKNGGIMDDKGVVVTFALPEGTKGQFLRIAATALSGVKDDKLPVNPAYADYAVTTDVSNNFRELFVIGALTEEIGAETDTGTSEPEDTTEAPSVIVKPPKKTEGSTTAAPAPTDETPAQTTAEEQKPKAGCQSSLPGIPAVLCVLALAFCVLKRRNAQ